MRSAKLALGAFLCFVCLCCADAGPYEADPYCDDHSYCSDFEFCDSTDACLFFRKPAALACTQTTDCLTIDSARCPGACECVNQVCLIVQPATSCDVDEDCASFAATGGGGEGFCTFENRCARAVLP